jgi:hypothetical protein
MADDLLFVLSSPGSVPLAEFNDWYDSEHVPARLATPGFGAIARYRACDGLVPEWLGTYEITPGLLATPAYRAVVENGSAREKSIAAAVAVQDRRVYSLLSDSGPAAVSGAAPVLMAVSMSVPAAAEDDMTAWYDEEHIPMLLAVPGWRRCRRFTLRSGDAPRFLSLHEIESQAAFDEPAYKAAVTTPWRNRVVESATEREKRVFDLYKSYR